MKQDLQDYNDKVDNNEQSASSGGYSKPNVEAKEKHNYWIYAGIAVAVITLIIILL